VPHRTSDKVCALEQNRIKQYSGRCIPVPFKMYTSYGKSCHNSIHQTLKNACKEKSQNLLTLIITYLLAFLYGQRYVSKPLPKVYTNFFF
jgi:hypothetical protein